jgi:hypothetical protein
MNVFAAAYSCCYRWNMNTAQLEFKEVEQPTPEQQVVTVLRRARDRYGRNLRPFFDELLARQPKPKTDEYSELLAVAKHRRQQG